MDGVYAYLDDQTKANLERRLIDRWDDNTQRLGCSHDRTCDWVALVLLCCCCIGKQFYRWYVVHTMSRLELWFAQSQGASLIKDEGIDIEQQLQRSPIFNQDTLTCGSGETIQDAQSSEVVELAIGVVVHHCSSGVKPQE